MRMTNDVESSAKSSSWTNYVSHVCETYLDVSWRLSEGERIVTQFGFSSWIIDTKAQFFCPKQVDRQVFYRHFLLFEYIFLDENLPISYSHTCSGSVSGRQIFKNYSLKSRWIVADYQFLKPLFTEIEKNNCQFSIYTRSNLNKTRKETH